jgi:hypothetical protein
MAGALGRPLPGNAQSLPSRQPLPLAVRAMIVETFFLMEEKRAMRTRIFQDLCRNRK